ncbi:MAG: IS66 family transposase [candidate division Zixibacteria bacterium]|nr:IS66 family transposase [candidate division Zixibacteria bacterium]
MEQNQLLTKHNIQLQQKVQMLEEKIARLEKNSSNSSKPPSSDIINPQPTNKNKTKRKIGGQKGHPKHSRPLFEADEIDNTIIHKLTAKEVQRRGLIQLDKTESALQQIDLPEKLYTVIEHRVQLYLGPNGEIIKAKLPKDIRKTGLFSTRTIALTGYLKARGHMSYSTLQSFFTDIMNLNVAQSYLAKICTKKLSLALQPAYAEAGQFIRNAPVVGTDETGHKNPAYKSAWTWCQQTPGAVFFHISNSRASKVLLNILGKDYSGVITCDYFSANKKFIRLSKALVQYCWAHLIRDIKFLLTLGYKFLKRWAKALLAILRKIFRLWKTRHSRHFERYKKSIEKLKKAFLQKVRRPPDHNEALNIKKRFVNGIDKCYFLFLERKGISPTNNLSEQAIRFVVIDRRITQGTRSWAGMRWCERAWTVVATCSRHKHSVYDFFVDAMNATYADAPYPKLIPAKL